jgi:hypothetical protein
MHATASDDTEAGSEGSQGVCDEANADVGDMEATPVEGIAELALEVKACKDHFEGVPTSGKQGVLGRASGLLQKAVTMDGDGNVIFADKDLLIKGFEGFAEVLDEVGKIGSHISCNVAKLRDAQVFKSEVDYQKWLVSELPVHASTKYKCYADPSAAMANLWIGWTLEFFVEVFAHLSQDQETAYAINAAYKETLANHHNFIMRNAFTIGMKRHMPNRTKLYELLQGDADPSVVAQEVETFVQEGRSIVQYLLQVQEVMAKALEAERLSMTRK